MGKNTSYLSRTKSVWLNLCFSFYKIAGVDKGDVMDHIHLDFSETVKVWGDDGESLAELEKLGIATRVKKGKGAG